MLFLAHWNVYWVTRISDGFISEFKKRQYLRKKEV